MPSEMMSSLASQEREPKREPFAIAPGIVTNNLDLISEGRVQVRIPTLPAYEPWARLPSVGGGSGRGFLWVPQIDDEVLVAFAQDDMGAAYVLGGLWSTRDRPPALLQTDFLTKRIIKTGMAGGLGHEIELDDLLQSITVTTSTGQSITLDPFTIELTNIAGSVTIAMDNKTQTISIKALNKIELKAPQIVLEGLDVSVKGVNVSVKGEALCSVNGALVKIN